MPPEVGPGAALCDVLIRGVENTKTRNFFKKTSKKLFPIGSWRAAPKKGVPPEDGLCDRTIRNSMFFARAGALQRPRTRATLFAVSNPTGLT